MKKRTEEGSLTYHPYLAFYCFMDSEWTIKRSENKSEPFKSFSTHERRFNDLCEDYRRRIEENYKRYCAASSNYVKNIDHDNDKLKEYLFRPINYITFGYSDLLSLVLLDDFDPISHINANVRNPIEDVGIAYCPTIKSLNMRNLDLNEDDDDFHPTKQEINSVIRVIRDPHDIFRIESNLIEHVNENNIDNIKSPLLAFTKYKMMGQGLIFQQTIFRAMASKILKALILLRRRFKIGDGTLEKIFNNGELNLGSLKVAFLDLQGTEEIGTIVVCDNYSVAMTLVASLRSLTYYDLYKTDSSGILRKSINAKIVNDLNKNIFFNPDNEEKKSYKGKLTDNHVFKWSNTSLAIRTDSIRKNRDAKIKGYVEAFTEIQISPGHQKEVENEIIETINIPRINIEKECKEQSIKFFYIGVSDYIFQNISYNERRGPKNILPTNAVLNILRKNIATFGSFDRKNDRGRDVIDILTRIAIPVPDLKYSTNRSAIFGEIGKEHYSFLSESLCILKNRIFYLENCKNVEKTKLHEKGKRIGQLDISKIKKIPRLYNLPVSLNRNIELLFQNYASLIGDPFTIDSVLDLYDAFQSLHYLLTNCLYKNLISKEERKGERKIVGLDSDRTKQIAKIVDALNNSLIHRTMESYPSGQNRDLASDFRGCMNQILLSAGAPIKSGLGIVKRIINETLNDLPKRNRQNTGTMEIGGIIKIGFEPGERCVSTYFGTEDKVKIAYFELDVPHVFHISSYSESLHEIFHILFDQMKEIGVLPAELSEIKNDVMKVRVNELFANMLCQLFIFGSDTERSICDFLISYFISSKSSGSDYAEILVKLSEYLIRLFIVIDAIPKERNVELSNLNWDYKEKADVNAALKRFKIFVHRIGDTFIYDKNVKSISKNEVDDFLWKQFEDIYPKTIEYMGWIWALAIFVYRKAIARSINGSRQQVAYINGAIRKSMIIGRPLTFNNYIKLSNKYGGHNKNIESYSMSLVCDMLREYRPKPSYSKMLKKAVMLFRNPNTFDINYYPADWYAFQIDKRLTQMFSPVPSVRSKRLLKQIVMFKTFWDIAAFQKEKQLANIVKDNW
jgi:hypothetical protein